jgi:hypothetical protein
MGYKKGLVFICLIICLFSIASVVAGDVNETVVASENQGDELIEIENHDFIETGDVNDTVMDSDDNKMESHQDSIDDDNLKSNEINEVLSQNPKTFSIPNATINGNDESDVYLNSNHTPELGSDYDLDDDGDDDLDEDYFDDDYLDEVDYNNLSIDDFEVYIDEIYQSARKGNINGVAIEILCEFSGGTFYVYINNALKSQKTNIGFTTFTLKDLGIVKSGFYKFLINYESPTGKKFTICTDQDVIIVKKNIELTLKTVKVKKSAKKLVLQATLKQKNKALSGKKITFKFNGKKYIAKTNKKGIAKVTIKKKVLKKLEVGKKVKYQASYGKVTVKKTVKVKK